MRKVIRSCLIVLGLACMSGAGLLYIDLQQDEYAAQTISATVTKAFQETVSDQPLAQLITLEEEPVTAVEIDGANYMALLTLPTLGLELPVDDTCTYSKLANTPCVYDGTLESNNLIIAAHNYSAHFGNIHTLSAGAVVTVLDTSGILHTFTCIGQETIDGNDTTALYSGDWDLTLFTCLKSDNTQRVVVRFVSMDLAS